MERIDLFDKYISHEMSETEVAEFKKKILEDKDFSSDFQIYKMVIRGIYKEENDKETELDNAFKNLSKEDLRNIVGPKMTVVKDGKSKAKVAYMTSWIASVAAVIVIAFTFTFNIQRSARNSIDDIMFDCYYNASSRSANCDYNLSKASVETIKQRLPNLVQEYQKSTDEQDVSERGMNLAMIYLKLHDRKKAKETLIDIRRKCSGNIQIQEQCNKLLENIR